jgi:hypothetical protein
MLSQPMPAVVVLSRNSNWNPPSILPLVGDVWDAGSTTYTNFYDSSGGILATVNGTVSTNSIDYSVPHGTLDSVPAGASFEMFVVTPDTLSHMIRYGTVFRREARFPNAPANNPAAQALQFSDTLQRTAFGSKWVPIVGTSALFADAGTNDVQTVTVGPASAGTFTLSVTAGGTTQPATGIAYNATAAALQSALAALPNVGTGNVTVTGTAPTWVVTFTGALGNAPQQVMIINGAGLTGGTPSVTHTTTGATTLYGAGAQNNLLSTSDSAMRWYTPLNTDSPLANVSMLNEGHGQTVVILCADILLSTYLGVLFDSNADTVQACVGTGPTTVTLEGSSVANTPANGDNYTVAYNDTTDTLAVYKGTSTSPLLTWVDSSEIVPHGPGYRYTGLAWINPASTNGLQISGWAAQDQVGV